MSDSQTQATVRDMWRRALAFFVASGIGFGPMGSARALPDDAVQRRAIRGATAPVPGESDALRRLREFETEAFPRPLPPFSQDEPPLPMRSASLGPDGIPDDLRSPVRKKPPMAEAPTSIPWLSQLRLPDFPIRFDARVLRYLEFYKDDRRGRAIIASWMKSQGRYQPLIDDALRRARLPLGLLFVSMIESGFDPHDKSHKGAVGLWQFLPEGARIYGLRVDYWVDERKNPEKSTEAAMRYLGDLKERFGGWPLALAAFNAGYGAVLRSMQKYNTNDYWELCRHEDGLPWDTILYVPKVMATALVAENRAMFGFGELKPDAPYAFDRVLVRTPISLGEAAKAAGVSLADVETLNPELRRRRVPPDISGSSWELRLPVGGGARFQASIDKHRGAVVTYVVRFGERLDELAREHGVSTAALKTMNGIDDVSDIRPGLMLVVPADKKPLPPLPCETIVVAVPDKEAAVPGRKRVFYRTLPTDSVANVADYFKVKETDLSRWNNLDTEARLASNMVIQIWVTTDFDTSQVALVPPSLVRVVTVGSDEFFDVVEARRGRARLKYVIKKGDDLAKVGKHYGLTVADLERINRFGAKKSPLVVGQSIVVYRTLSSDEKAKACKLVPGGTDVRVSMPPDSDPQMETDGETPTHEPDLSHQLGPKIGPEAEPGHP